MLQQTQMPVVLRYYKNFLDRFPTIADLAAATTDDVTAAWSGLGYYRRARMMRDGAIAVQDRFDGRLPDDVASLMTIPGIGRYTAGAIASIAYNRVAPIVDGNIARIIARLYGNDRNPWQRAEALVEASSAPRIFNQALMEIGALICRRIRRAIAVRCAATAARSRVGAQRLRLANDRNHERCDGGCTSCAIGGDEFSCGAIGEECLCCRKFSVLGCQFSEEHFGIRS